MTLTHEFRDTVVARARDDVAFRVALVEEVIQAFLDGDMAEARSMLRDCIEATVGFTKLGEMTHTPVRSLRHMVGPNGNPSAGNLLNVLRAVQRGAGVHAQVRVQETREAGNLASD